MLIHKLDDELWVILRGANRSANCCYDSREAAWRALALSDEEQRSLHLAANVRAGGSGAISLQDVVAALAVRRDRFDDPNRFAMTQPPDASRRQ